MYANCWGIVKRYGMLGHYKILDYIRSDAKYIES